MHDLVIIGAGVAGSSLAAALASRGWDVALLERRQFPHHKVCGEFLSPESQASLRALGLYDTVAALKPSTMTQAHLFSRRGIHLQVKLPGVAWGLSRFALDTALAGAAARAGAQVREGITATTVQSAKAGYEVAIRDARGEPAIVRGRAIAVACGRHPLPGLRPDTTEAHARPSHVGVKCHYEGLVLPPEVRLYLFDGGYAGLCPIEGGRANMALLVTQAAFARAGGVRAMIDLATKLNPTLGRDLAAGRALPESEVAVAPVDTGRPAAPWDRFARLGDAAVMIPPLCGDGMAMALRAAELCARLAHEFLCGERSLASWEAHYRATWRHEFERPIRVGRILQSLLSTPGVGDALLGVGALLPPLSARLVRATRAAPATGIDS
jgi:menaquinone-9 beta-reductase